MTRCALPVFLAAATLVVAGGASVPPAVAQSDTGPTLSVLKKRVASQQKALRAQRAELRRVRAKAKADRLERDATINEAWKVAGQEVPELRQGTLAENITAKLAQAQAALAASQAAQVAALAAQIAAIPDLTSFRSALSAMCSRARAVSWECSTYVSGSYVSIDFTRF